MITKQQQEVQTTKVWFVGLYCRCASQQLQRLVPFYFDSNVSLQYHLKLNVCLNDELAKFSYSSGKICFKCYMCMCVYNISI